MGAGDNCAGNVPAGGTIYIIRHGQTRLNHASALQGRSDSPLNENGMRQAQEAGSWLREHGITFSQVYSSPLVRAVQTAELAAPGADIRIDDRLIEMDYGPYEGTDLRNPPPEILEFFSDFVHNPAPKGMEQLSSVVDRAGAFLEEIRNQSGNILISTHAIAMKGLLEYLTPDSGGSYWSRYIGNCEIYTVENRGGILGIPKKLPRGASGEAPGGPERAVSDADLHMHSTASDGTDSPDQLAGRLRDVGIRVFALTDHDTVDGAEQLRAQPPEGIFFIPGIEFSCRMASGKCHILGYGCDFASPAFRAALGEGERLRRAKLETRITFLREECGVCFPEEELERLRRVPAAGKPHLANLMVKYGYAAGKDEAIRNTLDRCRTGESRIPARTAVGAILESGGLPVWAHPLGGEGESETDRDTFARMLEELLSFGLRGLECYYSRYTMEQCAWLAGQAEKHGMLISGGSDYHGANKTIAAGTLNAAGKKIPAERLTILDVLRKKI